MIVQDCGANALPLRLIDFAQKIHLPFINEFFLFPFSFFLPNSCLNLFGISRMVEGKEAIEDVAAGGFANGKS